MLNLSRIQVACCLAFLLCLQTGLLACFALDSEFDQTFNAGLKALQEGKLTIAEKSLKDTLKMEDKQGATDMKKAQSMMMLADFYKVQRRYAESESLYKQLLAKFEANPNGGELPAVLSRLAGLYKAENKLDDSMNLYKRALGIVEKNNGVDSAPAGTLHSNIALLFQRMNKLKEAEQEELTAIKILEAKQGPDSLEVAQCKCDLAPQYLFEHKNKQGVELLEQALAIYTKVAPDGLPYANCAEQLGSCYYNDGRFVDAEELSRKALVIYQKRTGPQSKDVAIALTNLAGRLSKQDKDQEAMDCLNKSLLIQEKATQFNPAVLTNFHGIEEIYVKQADFKKAEQMLRHDLEYREKKLGPKNPSLVPVLKNLANCLVVEGSPQEEVDVLLNRKDEIMNAVPVTKRKVVEELVVHDTIKGLDLNTKKSKKKNGIW